MYRSGIRSWHSLIASRCVWIDRAIELSTRGYQIDLVTMPRI